MVANWVQSINKDMHMYASLEQLEYIRKPAREGYTQIILILQSRDIYELYITQMHITGHTEGRLIQSYAAKSQKCYKYN